MTPAEQTALSNRCDTIRAERGMPLDVFVAIMRDGARAAHNPRHDPDAAGHGIITPAEQRVLDLLAEGVARDRAIAARLYVSPRTVGRHIRAIFHALDVHSRIAAVAEARRRGLITSEAA